MLTAENDIQAKSVVRSIYGNLNSQLNCSIVSRYSTFLNYGYVASDENDISSKLLGQRVLNHHSKALIIELVGLEDLNGATVLDVGCGRGGNAQFLGDLFELKEMIGLDLSPAAIEFCCRNSPSKGHRFIVGDAEAVPLAARSCDAVLNIESSHSYPHLEKFYSEAARLLRLGGCFLYADIMPSVLVIPIVESLQRLGFDVDENRDITVNVLNSRRQQHIQSDHLFEGEQTEALREFLGLPGSDIFDRLVRGELCYRLMRLRKVRESADMSAESELTHNPLLSLLLEQAARTV